MMACNVLEAEVQRPQYGLVIVAGRGHLEGKDRHNNCMCTEN